MFLAFILLLSIWRSNVVGNKNGQVKVIQVRLVIILIQLFVASSAGRNVTPFE